MPTDKKKKAAVGPTAVSKRLATLRSLIQKHGKAILLLDRRVRHLERYAHKHDVKAKYVVKVKPLREKRTDHKATK